MKKYLKIVAISIFLLSCTDVERDNKYDMHAVNYIGKNSEEPSSSSSFANSSSSLVQDTCLTSDSVYHGGENYPTVVIGTQTWFARNLRYVPGPNESFCYSDEDTKYKCSTYGRLYNWSYAMIANENRDVCPEGWHIPSINEWRILIDFVGSDATKLMAKEKFYGKGKDTYCFSALAGGYVDANDFHDEYNLAIWWSSSDSLDNAKGLRIHNSYGIQIGDFDKKLMLHVRCVKNENE